MYVELVQGKRPQSKPCKRFKENLMGPLKKVSVDTNTLEDLASVRKTWRNLIAVGVEKFENNRIETNFPRDAPTSCIKNMATSAFRKQTSSATNVNAETIPPTNMIPSNTFCAAFVA